MPTDHPTGLRRWLDDIHQDLGFGLRTLLKNPAFGAVAVVTLALATGATTAIFSVVNSVLVRPLPFPAPDRLVVVAETWQVGDPGVVVMSDLDEFGRQSEAFASFAGHSLTTRHLDGPEGLERLTAVVVQRDFFRVLGTPPIAGRTFDRQDMGQLAVISARLWRERFDSAQSMIGRSIVLTGQRFDQALGRTVVERQPFVVVGVMPEAFQFPYGAASTIPGALPESRTDVWLFDDRAPRAGRLHVTGRVKPGISIESAASELALIKQRIDAASTDPYRPTGVRVTPLSDVVLAAIRPALWLLAGAVGLVLAAACANVANLLLARTMAREREVVTRMALGAGRLRLVRQLLTESVLIASLGGAAGAAVAWWGTDLLVMLAAPKIPRAHEITLDWSAFAFLLLVCLVTAILFGLAPALTAARADVPSITKDAAGRATIGRTAARLRDGLVVAELAVAFVLASGAALVVREVDRLKRTDTGMQTDDVLTFHLTPRATDQDYYRIEARVQQERGIEAAGLIQLVPLQNWGWIGTFTIRGRPRERGFATAELRTVTPGYFRALGIPLRAGRELTERDSLASPRVILINDALARQHFANEDAIGRETDRGIIVGVVGDVRQVALDRPAVPEIYQLVGPDAGIAPDIGMSLVVRAPGDQSSIAAAVRRAVREVNPNLAIFNIRPMSRVVADSLWELNLYRWLIGLFSALAIALAAIGLYGVINYAVTTRTREFAVRLALGSDPRRLGRGIFGRGVLLALVGLVIGAPAFWALAALAEPNLPVGPGADPLVLALTAAALVALALLASMGPALRIARVDPAAALRHE